MLLTVKTSSKSRDRMAPNGGRSEAELWSYSCCHGVSFLFDP